MSFEKKPDFKKISQKKRFNYKISFVIDETLKKNQKNTKNSMKFCFFADKIFMLFLKFFAMI